MNTNITLTALYACVKFSQYVMFNSIQYVHVIDKCTQLFTRAQVFSATQWLLFSAPSHKATPGIHLLIKNNAHTVWLISYLLSYLTAC